MKKASGVAIILGGKILLCHPTNSPWNNSYSIPKGLMDDGETELQTALRECLEEVGIDLSGMTGRFDGPYVVEYRNKKAEPYKTVAYYVLRIDSLSEIGLETETVPISQLQLDEVDWAGFVDAEEAPKRILWRFIGILDKI